MHNKINPRNIFLMPYRVLSSLSSTVNDLVQNLLKKNEKEYCRKLFSILIAIPTKDKESFGRQVSSLLSENTSFNNKVIILHILDKTLRENRKILIEQTVRLISDTTSDEDKIEIFSLLSSIFSEDSKKHIDIEKLITQTLQLSSESITDKKILLFALHEILVNEPTINTEMIVMQSLRLISPTMSSFDKLNIIKDLASIPNEDREVIIDQACQLISDITFVSERRDFLRVLKEDRDIVTQSLRLISPTMSSSDKLNIIRDVASIPNEDRKVIIDLAYRLISDTMSVSERRDFLRVLKEDRDIVTQSLGLIYSVMSSNARKEILRRLVSIPKEDKESILTQVIQLLSHIIDRSDPLFAANIAQLLVSLNFIQRKERKIIVEQCLLLIANSNMSIGELLHLIQLLSTTPMENREIVVRQARQLINDTTSSNKTETIIEQSLHLIANSPNPVSVLERIVVVALINEFPIENREDIVKQSLRLISPTMSISYRINILKNVATIPNEDREVIIDLACQLISDTTSGNDRREILSTLVSIPKEDRESVGSQVIRLISHNIDRSDPLFDTNIRNFLLSLTSIPREQREIIVTQSLSLIRNSNMSIQERSHLTRLLFNIPLENREIVVRQAQQLINDTTSSNSNRRETIIEQSLHLIAHSPNAMSGFERITVLVMINDLPIEDREDFVEQAIRFINTTSINESTEVIIAQAYQLITDSMSTIDRLTIFQMFLQLPIGDREDLLVQFSEQMPIHMALTTQISVNQNNRERMMLVNRIISGLKKVFKVNSNEINESPIKVIINLFDMINRNKILLLPDSIKYTNSEGIDTGGITRSFITDLINAFSKSDDLVTKGEFGVIPSLGKDNASLSIEDQKKCFKIMGRFFSAAIQKHQSIVIGRHVHPIVFEMIFSLNKDDFTKENSAKTFDKLLSIYLKKEFNLEEKEVKDILEDNLSQEFKDIYCIDSKENLIKSYEIDKKIDGTLIIAKAMYDSLSNPTYWDPLKGDSVDKFQQKIEGTLSNNAVVHAFRNDSANEMSFQYIKKWSQRASSELLQKLVKAISGTIMLTPDAKFRLINLGGAVNKLPVFHTCNFTVELSKYSSYEEFKEKLELSLTYCFEENGFQMG